MIGFVAASIMASSGRSAEREESASRNNLLAAQLSDVHNLIANKGTTDMIEEATAILGKGLR